MNYGEIKAQIANMLHRTDLTEEIESNFIPAAINALKRRLNVDIGPFAADGDTDPFTDESPFLLIYKAVSEGYGWLHNGPAAESYNSRWVAETDQYYITNYAGTESPVIGVSDGT